MNIRLTYTPPQLDIFFPAKPERHTIIPKGRRFGATRGAAHACIEWGVEGAPMLWGDTIHGNIDRYVERYFLPAIKTNGIRHDWQQQKKLLKIMDGFIDFRSSDNPSTWEGFGYRKIVLNEAGIILKDPYLYTNAVRPMMIDHPDSELYALGVPKGKVLKDGREHPFYTMWQRVGTPGYRGQAYSSYDNPMLGEEDIAELEADIAAMDPMQVDQEIYGKFIDRVAGRPFAFAFDEKRHVKECELDLRLPVYVSLDFNVDPFCALIAQQQGQTFAITHEIAIQHGTIDELVERIHAIAPQTFMHEYTGDRTGAAKRIQVKSNASMWDDFLDAMRAREGQLKLPANPTHKNSREQCNYVLTHHSGFIIHPRCNRLIHDLRVVEVDDDMSIIKTDRSKASQQADLLDCFRYICNTFLFDYITRHRKTNVMHHLRNGRAAVTVQ